MRRLMVDLDERTYAQLMMLAQVFVDVADDQKVRKVITALVLKQDLVEKTSEMIPETDLDAEDKMELEDVIGELNARMDAH